NVPGKSADLVTSCNASLTCSVLGVSGIRSNALLYVDLSRFAGLLDLIEQILTVLDRSFHKGDQLISQFLALLPDARKVHGYLWNGGDIPPDIVLGLFHIGIEEDFDALPHRHGNESV